MAQFKAEGVHNLGNATVERWFPDLCLEGTRAAMLEQAFQCTHEGY
jgi:hypothetical protein